MARVQYLDAEGAVLGRLTRVRLGRRETGEWSRESARDAEATIPRHYR